MLFLPLQSRSAHSILIACLICVWTSSVSGQNVPIPNSRSTVPAVFGIKEAAEPSTIQLVTAVEPVSAQNPIDSKNPQQSDNEIRASLTQPAGIQNPASTVPVVSEPQSKWISESLSDMPIQDPTTGYVPSENYVLPESAIQSFNFASPFHRYDYYRSEESTFFWVPASDDNLGWLSLESSPYLSNSSGNTSEPVQGITSAINIHWLNGPGDIDLPARVYDFVLGYQKKETLNSRFSYDVAGSVGVYSDFEDSARDGIRFVSHAVGMIHATDRFDFVFGVDYLDRNDLAILPVIGFSFRPHRLPKLKIDAIFPRPELAFAISQTDHLYVRGLMGGGSWDIEFPDESNDVMTYRDFQILFGISRQKDDHWSRWEIGYVFERQLEFSERTDQREFDDSLVIRFITLK